MTEQICTHYDHFALIYIQLLESFCKVVDYTMLFELEEHYNELVRLLFVHRTHFVELRDILKRLMQVKLIILLFPVQRDLQSLNMNDILHQKVEPDRALIERLYKLNKLNAFEEYYSSTMDNIPLRVKQLFDNFKTIRSMEIIDSVNDDGENPFLA